MRPFSNRDPFDPVVKGAGSNPDVMGSNPMTSRFFGLLALLPTYMLISLCEKREMVDFKEGNGILHRIWLGSGADLEYWSGSGPARTRRGYSPVSRRACTPTHMHSHTHMHTRTPAHTIDFNTPRLLSFGKIFNPSVPKDWGVVCERRSHRRRQHYWLNSFGERS